MLYRLVVVVGAAIMIAACGETVIATPENDAPEYFKLRPEVEDDFGYRHAVRIGEMVRVSGAVSMDDEGVPTAVGDIRQQMINIYEDLEKILAHYGCGFDDVVSENVFTTDMAAFLEVSNYRNTLYTNGYPTGSWLEVKGLALPEFDLEIEVEADGCP